MFHDNDVICFLGDSITANGLWMSEVYQVLRKKYKVRCYNCGVSGSTARCAKQYLHTYELDAEDGAWERFEDLCRLISGKKDIFYGTNSEVLL